MNRETLESILEAVRRLPPVERMRFADEVDRIAWSDRMQWVLNTVRALVQREGEPPTDDEINAMVKDVRSEESLYERYWTLRRSSAV